jgi:hypothetical protein
MTLRLNFAARREVASRGNFLLGFLRRAPPLPSPPLPTRPTTDVRRPRRRLSSGFRFHSIPHSTHRIAALFSFRGEGRGALITRITASPVVRNRYYRRPDPARVRYRVSIMRGFFNPRRGLRIIILPQFYSTPREDYAARQRTGE